MSDKMSDKKQLGPRNQPGEKALSSEANESGMFRWYQDLLDRIMPKKKEGPEE